MQHVTRLCWRNWLWEGGGGCIWRHAAWGCARFKPEDEPRGRTSSTAPETHMLGPETGVLPHCQLMSLGRLTDAQRSQGAGSRKLCARGVRGACHVTLMLRPCVALRRSRPPWSPRMNSLPPDKSEVSKRFPRNLAVLAVRAMLGYFYGRCCPVQT